MKTRLLTVALLATLAGAGASAAEQVTYRVMLKGTWTAASHPHEYPSAAHFSWLTGATHDAGYRLFEVGATATPGLEALAEDGELSPFDAEIQAAIERATSACCSRPGRSTRCPARQLSRLRSTSAIRWSRW